MAQGAFVIINGVLISCYSEQTHIQLPEGVTRIGSCAFRGCENMKSIALPPSLERIDPFGFLLCDKLESISLPSGIRRIGKAAFKGCRALADEAGFVIVNRMLHDYCGKAEDVVIPEHVSTIGYEAFFRKPWLRSVTIPETVTGISHTAFDACPNLVLQVRPGSYGAAYAREKGIPFVEE